MRLSFSQDMRQVQKQILAPRMIQSMEILQLPIMALQERIEQELQENEMLEVTDTTEEFAAPEVEDRAAPDENPKEKPIEQKELVVDESHANQDDFARLDDLDTTWPESFEFEERPRTSSGRIEDESNRKHDAMANAEARSQTLQDYLNDQLAYYELDPDVRRMAQRIIYNLDHHGRLPGPLVDILDPNAGPEELALAERGLAIVQKLEPLGVGARDLRECLLLQLRPGQPYFEELRTLISDHLEDIERNRLPLIEKRTGYTIDRIQEALSELRKLNPKPGADFDSVSAAPVIPDVYVEPVEGGGYSVRLEDTELPNLYISPYYRALLQNGDADAKTREYIKRKINSAQWLIDSIQQRRNTLLRVSQAIVDHQKKFLDEGPEAIEPLKMQQIADKVGVHVTTVSRAVDGKWLQAPRGIFPLKRFFVGGTVGTDGEEVAWDIIRLKLQEIIDHEDKANPLSDDDLVKELAKGGMKVARRTVTKYRKAMAIPSSRERKDWTVATHKHEHKAEEGSPAPDAHHANGNGAGHSNGVHIDDAAHDEPLVEHSASGHSASGHSASGHSASGHSASGHSASGHAMSEHAMSDHEESPEHIRDESATHAVTHQSTTEPQ